MAFSFSVYSWECSLLVLRSTCRMQVLLEPPRSELRDLCECLWFFKEMRGPWDDLQGFLTAELDIGCLVQGEHCGITPTDNEQSG